MKFRLNEKNPILILGNNNGSVENMLTYDFINELYMLKKIHSIFHVFQTQNHIGRHKLASTTPKGIRTFTHIILFEHGHACSLKPPE